MNRGRRQSGGNGSNLQGDSWATTWHLSARWRRVAPDASFPARQPTTAPPLLSSLALTLQSNGLSPAGGINNLLHPCVLRLSKDRLNINSSFASVLKVSYTYICNYFFTPFPLLFFLSLPSLCLFWGECKRKMKLPYKNKSRRQQEAGWLGKPDNEEQTARVVQSTVRMVIEMSWERCTKGSWRL